MKEVIYQRHDVYCNQKYADTLPYSFHLKCVEAQGEKFLHLIDEKIIRNENNSFSKDTSLTNIVKFCLCGHDLEEDARMTYNDVLETATDYLGNTVAGKMAADIIHCCTDEKGKTRCERKNDKFYKELAENEIAVFIKLADLSANTIFSKLTNSSMYKKYKEEFIKFKEYAYVEQYKEFFDYLEVI